MNKYLVRYVNCIGQYVAYTVYAEIDCDAWTIANEVFKKDNADGHLNGFDLEGVYLNPN